MKDDVQSQKEAINLMTKQISSKESCRIGTWGVHEKRTAETDAQFTENMKVMVKAKRKVSTRWQNKSVLNKAAE